MKKTNDKKEYRRAQAVLEKSDVIGKAVWNEVGDIRDVISIGKLVRKNDGPEEVKQIIIIKYGEIKEH